MADGPSIVVRFLGDAKKLTDEVDSATTKASGKFSDFAKKAAVSIGGVFAVREIAQFATDAVNAASDLQEAGSKVGVVFGDQAASVKTWAENSATAFGLSEEAALSAAGTYGNLAVSLGLPEEKAADMSTSLVELAGDLASFNNVPVDDALKALQSGLTGETEPLKKFGVNLNDATLKAEAMALGLYDGKGNLDAAAKAQASYSLILKQTGTAQGDFARTSDGLANKQRIAAAQFENLKAKIGSVLLPVMTTVVAFISDSFIPALTAISDWVASHGEVIAAAFVGVGIAVATVIVPAFIAWAAGAAAAAAATLLAAAPFIAIGAVIAGVAYLIIHNWETIVAAATTTWDAVTDAVKGAFDWVKNNWPLLLAIITGPIGAAVLIVTKNWDSIKAAAQAVWDWLNNTWDDLTEIIVAPIRSAVDTVKLIWGELKDAATGAYDWVKEKFDDIAGAIEGAISGITTAIGKVVDAITGPLNIVIRAWNGLEFRIPEIKLPEFDTHIPGVGKVGGGTVGGQTIGFPDIPELARGGVLTAPTLFVGGEAGTEIVTPEDLLRSIVAEESGRGSYTLNMFPRTADAADIAYAFARLEMLAGVA